MKRILADKLKAGDMLAKDILSDKGMPILKKGAVLTDKFIENIKKLNSHSSAIAENYVFIEENGGTNEESCIENKEEMKNELALLEKRFQDTENDEAMVQIKEIIKSVIIKNYGGDIV
jgi:predicted ribosome quality control (RQC) complex YloA/Tae2 family protein